MIEIRTKRSIHLLIELNGAFLGGAWRRIFPTDMRIHAITIKNSCYRNLPHLSNFVILLLETLVRHWHVLPR